MKRNGRTRARGGAPSPSGLLLPLLTALFLFSGGIAMANDDKVVPKRVVLIGASVGKAWNVPGLPERSGSGRYVMEYVGCYRYDKTQAFEEVLRRTESRPDAVIIKECAAYFPSDISFKDARELMVRWIEQTRQAGIRPIPATVVPVTKAHDEKYKTTNPLKRLVKKALGISMMTQMDRIAEFNDWLKGYCEKQGLVCLDLETPLLIGENDRYLRDDLAKPDGLHLKPETYALLDAVLINALERVFAGR